MDYEIRQFKEDLVDFLNKYQLPIEIKRLVVGEVYRLLEDVSVKIIQGQIAELQKKKENEQEEVKEEQNE